MRDMTTSQATEQTMDDIAQGRLLASRCPELYDQYMDMVCARDLWLAQRDAQSWDIPAPPGAHKMHRAELARQVGIGGMTASRGIRNGRKRLGLPVDPPEPPPDADYVGPREVPRSERGTQTVEHLAAMLAGQSRHDLARELAKLRLERNRT